MLWYINRTALHPHGLALALHYADENDPNTIVGWSIIKAEDGLWSYPNEDDQAGRDRFAAFMKEIIDDKS